MTFCQAFEDAERRTRLLVDLLVANDLLDRRQVHHNEGGNSILLLDYETIDVAKLDALADDAFLELRHKGALVAIVTSNQNWQKLTLKSDA